MKKEEVMEELGITSEKELKSKLVESQTDRISSSNDRESLKKSGVSFEELSKRLPVEGDRLFSEGGKLVKVYEDWKTRDGAPFQSLFCYAKIDDRATGWYLHSRPFGLICLLTLRTFEKVTVIDGERFVKDIRVLRPSSSNRGLVCEVLYEE